MGPLISTQPRDAKAIEQAVGTVDGLDPVEVGAELGDQGLDVDAVRGGTVVLERDQRLREEVDGAARRAAPGAEVEGGGELHEDRKSTRLNSSHSQISYAVFCLKKKKISIRTRDSFRYASNRDRG